MKIILLPITALILLLCGLLLVAAALAATLCSLIASFAAKAIIWLLVFQESPALVAIMSFLGTEPPQDDTKEMK